MTRKHKTNHARDTFLYQRAVLADPALSAPAKCVLFALVLEFRNNETGLCIPGFAKIAKTVGRSRRAVVPAVAELSTSGWLKIISTKGGSKNNTNKYIIDLKQREPVRDATSLPVKPASPVKQNAGGVSYTAHEPSSNMSPLQGDMCVGDKPPSRAPVGAAPEEKNNTALWESFQALCTIWWKPDGIDVPAAWKSFQAVCDDHPAEDILASAARWVASTEPRYLKKLEEWLGNGAWRNEPPARRAEPAARRQKANPAHAMLRAGGWGDGE